MKSAILLFILFVASICFAQRPLQEVRSIAPWVENRQSESLQMTIDLANAIGDAGLFRVVTTSEPHDAWLVVRTCDAEHRLLDPKYSDGQLCVIALSDALANDRPPIWQMKHALVRQIISTSATREEALAKMVSEMRMALQLATNASVEPAQGVTGDKQRNSTPVDRPLPPGAKRGAPVPTMQPISLARLRTIYVDRQDNSQFRAALQGALIQWEKVPKNHGDIKYKPKGSCEQGYPSIITGIKIVCSSDQADAILIGISAQGPSEQTSSKTSIHCDQDSTGNTNCTGSTSPARSYRYDYGTAFLYDRQNALLWSATRDSGSVAMSIASVMSSGAAPPVAGGIDQVAVKIVKQLRKDIESIRKRQ